MSETSAINPNPLLKMIISRLPGRMKRMVFLASLAAVANDTGIPEKDLIRKLNQVMGLSTTGDSALHLPIAVSSVIWKNKELLKKEIKTLADCTDADGTAQECAMRIANATPQWMTGADSPQDVAQDVIKMFTKEGGPFSANAPLGA